MRPAFFFGRPSFVYMVKIYIYIGFSSFDFSISLSRIVSLFLLNLPVCVCVTCDGTHFTGHKAFCVSLFLFIHMWIFGLLIFYISQFDHSHHPWKCTAHKKRPSHSKAICITDNYISRVSLSQRQLDFINLGGFIVCHCTETQPTGCSSFWSSLDKQTNERIQRHKFDFQKKNT